MTQEKDKEKRKAELTVEYEEKVAEKKVTKEEEEGTSVIKCTCT